MAKLAPFIAAEGFVSLVFVWLSGICLEANLGQKKFNTFLSFVQYSFIAWKKYGRFPTGGEKRRHVSISVFPEFEEFFVLVFIF